MRSEILQEREKTHGAFYSTAVIAQELKSYMHKRENFKKMQPPKQEALDMIATKIARILSGDTAFKEHWIDIAGYAQLGAEACD